MKNPPWNIWVAVKHVFRYLKGTQHYGLQFCKDDKGLNIHGYCDADWAGATDRKSTSGYCFKLNDNSSCISWRSQKQPVVALSTCEAEYVALTVAVQEALFLKQLLQGMFIDNANEPVTVVSDDQGAIALAKNPIVSQRSKHIDIKYHNIRDIVQSGFVDLLYVPTNFNLADVLTKSLSKVKLDFFKQGLFK